MEGVWVRSTEQIVILRDIWNSLPESYQYHQERIVQNLFVRLQNAALRIRNLGAANASQNTLLGYRMDPFGHRKKAKYSLMETSLTSTIDDLEAWQRQFDPSWYLIIRIANTTIDKTLTKSQKYLTNAVPSLQRIREQIKQSETSSTDRSMIHSKEFLLPNVTSIPGSTTVFARASSDWEGVLVDTTMYPKDAAPDTITAHVTQLAHLLSSSDPSSLGLLTCMGIIQLPRNERGIQQFQLLFKSPTGYGEPSSLRSALDAEPGPLNDRISIANGMAKAVMSVHTAAFVHKNIRPETIMIFSRVESSRKAAFLTGFERFRLADSGSTLAGDMLWEKNLYRHPSRQGLAPEEFYTMHHDIYSLGVCLLEIGLWVSFVSIKDPKRPAPILDISDFLVLRNQRVAALQIKQKLLQLAQEKLPSIMGTTYTEVAVTCLTCLDKDRAFSNYQDNQDDQSVVAMGVNFMEMILERLESIHF